jgi:type I restriction enzyme M protein
MARVIERSGAPGAGGATLDFERQLWAMADGLRGHMDAAEYKHVVLGKASRRVA